MRKNTLLYTFVIAVYIFILFPIIVTVLVSFNKTANLAIPSHGISLDWYVNAIKTGMFIKSFKHSFQIAIYSTLIALIIGLPTSYILTRNKINSINVLKNFFLLPIVIPSIVLSFALFQFLIIKFQIANFTALLIGHTLVLLPYTIRVITASLDNFDYTIEQAALSLGASRFKSIVSIVMPNIYLGIIAAFTLSFITSFNNIPISLFLTGPGISVLPIEMMGYIEYYYDPTVAAISVILMIITIAIMFVIEKTLGLNYFTK